jgi:phosphonate transport system permease protein
MNQGVHQPAYVSDKHYRGKDKTLTVRRVAATLAFGIVLILCWRYAEIRPTAIFEPGAAAAVWAFISGLFPPDLSPDFLRVVATAVAQTVAIAIAGTTLSILIGLPLGVMATPILWRRGVLVAGDPPSASRLLLTGLSRATRALFGFLRAVPDLVWGLLFVVAVGLGSLAGTLALAVSYSGVLGRVYADVFEDVDSRALEALHATGATRAQIFLRAIWPQAVPSITAYTLYSLECCVRAAAVLGFIGAGGIGYEISLSMRLFDYGQVMTLIVSLIVLVAVTDTASRFLRRRLHANAPAGSLAHQHTTGIRGFHRRLTRHESAGHSGVSVILILAIAWSFYATGLFNIARADSGVLTRVFRFIGEMVPPDLSPEFLRALFVPLLQTVGISVIGTLIGLVIGAVLSLPATSTLMLGDDDDADKNSWLGRAARWLIYLLARLTLNVLRSIPELVWVLVCIIAVGLGPYAGTLAIGIHTAGVLGKLYAETLEEVPPHPVEALRSNGARRFQILLWGMWPQARPTLVSYTVLRWEMNLRVSTILGLVGGGGLGQAIYNNVQLGFYSRIAVLIAVIYALVMTTDWLGDLLRTRRPAV